MSRTRRKPTDPQEIARRRAEKIANEAEIERLRSQGVVVNLDRARRIVAAYRSSPFHKLREAKTITGAQSSAAERLCVDWAIWRGLDGRPERSEVHAETYGRTAEIVSDRMLLAGKRIEKVLARVGPLDRDLLGALCASVVEDDCPLPWRDIVRRISGVTQVVRQSQMVVASLENLSRAYSIR